MSDGLAEIIEIARRSAPEVPNDAWAKIESAVRRDFGAQRVYIAARRKRQHLQDIEKSEERDARKIAQMLGVSVQHANRMKKLI